MTVAAHSIVRIDRRLDERRDCLTGLARWLEAARRTLNLDALALADSSGCLVAGAGSAQCCEEMAALAPLSHVSPDPGQRRISAMSLGAAWLCAPTAEIPADHWQAVRHGCLRILGWSEAS